MPFSPGGGTDFIARFIAQRLSAFLGQQFIVENKPGAGTPEQFLATIKKEIDVWRKVVGNAGIKVE